MIVYYTYLKYLAFAVVTVTLPIVALIILKFVQKFSAGKVKSLVCLNGKTAIVTGGSSGVGFETALVLASRGARVILADRKDATNAKNKIIEITHNTNIVTKHLDLSSLQSVRKFAKEINATEERLDVLINNAGVGKVTNKHTDDGLHATMQVNHFGPFLLTHLLSGLLKKSAPSRIIFVSSVFSYCSNLTVENLNYPQGHPLSVFRTSLIFGNSKLANIISSNGFAEKLKEHGVTSNSLHPGLINKPSYVKPGKYFGLQAMAKLARNIVLYAYGKSPEEGAQTTIHLALSNKLKDVSGKYFSDCRVFPLPPGAWNKKFCDAIWEKSEELVQLKPEEKL
ncbi:hypothetical protein NQ315_011854 [Exocentrus adspersus]|uniref:Retinol dehydrogenase 11 n=1 Tax=Exocentrus adspersus TaxID=1586481 RepID=A0AAV8W138_9CUCU|nr:hypothetical protein NQ315_011854 [Exocentrus adspersus]